LPCAPHCRTSKTAPGDRIVNRAGVHNRTPTTENRRSSDCLPAIHSISIAAVPKA
jgi:hypothetical protein